MDDAVEEPAIEANSWGESKYENADIEPIPPLPPTFYCDAICFVKSQRSQTYPAKGYRKRHE